MNVFVKFNIMFNTTILRTLVGGCILLGNSKMIAQSTIGAASGKGSISNQLPAHYSEILI